MRNIQKVWVIGSEGRLGRAIRDLLDVREVEVLATDIEDVDITDTQEVLRYADMSRPDVMINCAGMTCVEQCEQNIEKAYQINAIGARNISIAASRIGARLVHISTDDIFDGQSKVPYTEFDAPNPQSAYGKSKLAGEQMIKDFSHKYFIIRSSWIYGDGDNFVNHVIKACKEKSSINVPKDQWGSPTSAKELAKLVLHLMETSDYGVYHGGCEGSCSRYELAQEILKLMGEDSQIEACSIQESDQINSRPAYTVLDNFMLRVVEHYQMAHWKKALEEYIKNLNI